MFQRCNARFPFRRVASGAAAAALVMGCGGGEGAPEAPAARDAPIVAEAGCTSPAVRDVVDRFGARMREVALLAPDSVVVADIREAYGPLVAPRLLESWVATPSEAPGREVSSPWPDRIDIASIEPGAAGGCRVQGDIVYVTSVEASTGGHAERRSVTLIVTDSAGWRISGYEARPR